MADTKSECSDDHRENEDCLMLKKALACWQEQLKTAEKDCSELTRLYTDAQEDPVDYVDSLLNDEDHEKVPALQKIHPAPTIDWQKYTKNNSVSHMPSPPPTPRGTSERSFSETHQLVQNKLTFVRSILSKYINLESLKNKIRIRLRPPTMPGTSGVSNEVPVANEDGYTFRRRNSMVHFTKTRVSGSMYAYSSLDSGVRMPESDDEHAQPGVDQSGAPVSTRSRRHHRHRRLCDLSENHRGTPEYRKLADMTQKRLRQRIRLHQSQQKHIRVQCSDAIHHGFRCDRCAMEPILGTRWTCNDCPDDHAVDLCQSCAYQGFVRQKHDETHWLSPVDMAEPYWNNPHAEAEPDTYGGVYSYLNC